MCVTPFRVSLSLLISFFSPLFGRSEPIIERNRYLSGIQPPFWGSFTTHLFSLRFRGADWKNLSQGLTEICLSDVCILFQAFFPPLISLSTFCLANNQKIDWDIGI